MAGELVAIDPSEPVPQWLDPIGFIEEATRVADALGKIIEDQKLYAVMGRDPKTGEDRKHIVVEAWQTLAAMHQVYPLIEWTRSSDDFVPRVVVTEWYTDRDGRRQKNVVVEQIGQGGWAARCVVTNREGNPIGGAEAECRYEEEKWRDRDSFSLRSMAQTRAISKALRGTLAYIVTLAGYNTTPAEELGYAPQAQPVVEVEPRPMTANALKAQLVTLAGDDAAAAKRLYDEALSALSLTADEVQIPDDLGRIKDQAKLIHAGWGASGPDAPDPFAALAEAPVLDAAQEEEAWTSLLATLSAGPPENSTVGSYRAWIRDLDAVMVRLGLWDEKHLGEVLTRNALPRPEAMPKKDLETFAPLYCDLAKKVVHEADEGEGN